MGPLLTLLQWAGLSPAVTEHRVLSFIPYLQKPPTHTQTGSAPASASNSTFAVNDDSSRKAAPVTSSSITDPYGPRQWNSDLVKLPGKNRALNEFSVERLGEEVDNNLVMLHGYGAGLGFYYKNFESLSRLPGWKLYALDLLGMGRSSRPPFRIHAKDKKGKITEAENWFVDALEDWRKQKKIDRFTLLGHSLGGYLAVAYALKYPGHLNKLVLASPVGIPEDPYAIEADMPEPGETTVGNEFTDGSYPSIPQSAKPEDGNNFLNARSKMEADREKAKPPRRPTPSWLTYLWEANISPFSLVRLSGPLGPRLVSGWTSRRFGQLPPEESKALHDYAYSLFRQKGSGEYALAYILAPGAYARSPLIRRIQGVGRQYLAPHAGPLPDTNGATPQPTPQSSAKTDVPKQRENGVPVVFMYGDHDWMDVKGGYAAEQRINEATQKALQGKSEGERRRDNGGAKVLIIKRAGHHVYLDGADEFNKVMAEEMKDVERREKTDGKDRH